MELRYASASPYVRNVTVLAIDTGLDGRQAVEVFFDPATRGSAAVPDEIRAAIEPTPVDPD